MRPAPSPRRGEGWGEGVTKDREIGSPSPPPSPQPKSDVSDFGHVIEWPNSGKPEFGWGEGVPPCRDWNRCSIRRCALVPDMNEIVPTHNIGDYVPMVDGPEKVSGRAKYTADLVTPGMLAGRIYRSPYAHGEIVAVDVSEAAKLPGVKAIVTGADCDRTFGVLPIARSEHPLARDKVRYRGKGPITI